MFKEEYLHGREELYGFTWRRPMVLVLLFLTWLCVLVYEGFAQYPLRCYISYMELRNA